jgi:hypothetical protein
MKDIDPVTTEKYNAVHQHCEYSQHGSDSLLSGSLQRAKE